MKIAFLTHPLALLFGLPFLFLGAGANSIARDEQVSPSELVRRLGSDQFQEREEATVQLEKIGSEAREALADGLNSSDPEIVRRCRILFPLIENQEMENLIKKLSSGSVDPEQLKLPGWDRFKEKVGADSGSKKYFLELCRSELPLIRDVERKPEIGFDLIQGRCTTFQRSNMVPNGRGPANVGVQISETELGAILFCALNPKVKVPTQNLHIINNLFYLPSARTFLVNSQEGTPFRRLIAQWLASPNDIQGLINNLYLAKNLPLREGVDLAARILQESTAKKLGVSPYQKGLALCALGKLGNKSHVKLVLQHFSDDNLIQINPGINNQDRISTQVNDIALAMAIHLTGQDHKNYGFPFSSQGRGLNFDPYGLGFSSQEKREEAFSKWTKWVKESKFDPALSPLTSTPNKP